MTNVGFENKLNELNLSKKEFVELVSMPYQTLMNWKQKDETPYWVEPFLCYYEKGKTLDELLALIDKFKK
ncbi:hypothetical protein FFA43_06170 [Campylobacter hyointestinalis subsp. hyointestinalis]|uniref:hypothetical protein n=1 Tax=Campylobacter hyointestinalis TaxID=198 RepID=UPI000724E130|nr:hypothetical protein [Campylobacter hyointestinalis]PPB55928.1 hypothetical protein CDQ71_09345 [Campylobacter hyointestinalis subsp. hyointestinalis]QCU00236.1 hypothetical protein FFA43_06170 [Campylobacter hyointestinalis subsp. hyointestinalis]CUU87731.1 acyl carrier protein [Campylobacter hyointestinalis subsp. hyointestinalis]